MANELSAKVFSEHLGSAFTVTAVLPETLILELYDVTENTMSPALEQFSLLFRGPVSPVMQQCTAKLEHDKLGSLELFLVPIGPDEKGMRYQAVFSRFRKEGQSE